ncbi:MAG: diacylglycerol kinase family lipid kinase [Verrucomicrobia bacterium]|nr:diacylglycerol kinase family lipid kinase [Verrucomicrobiota bacterium]
MPRRLLAIRNPAAGGSRSDRAQALLQRLRAAGHVVEERVTSGPGDAIRLASSAGGGFEVVLAIGGDGTVNEVANGLLMAGHAAALAVAAFGTGNDVAQLLGTRQETTLLRVLETAAPRRVDTLEVRNSEGVRHALLFAGCGIATRLLQQTTPRVKRWFGGRGSYAIGFLRALRTHRGIPMRVHSPAGDWESHAGTVLVAAKAPHAGGGGLQLAPSARPDDGTLHGLFLGPAGRLAILGHFLRLSRGAHIGHPALRCFATPWIEVSTDPPMPLALDGELVGFTPARFDVRPRSLAVLATSAPC